MSPKAHSDQVPRGDCAPSTRQLTGLVLPETRPVLLASLLGAAALVAGIGLLATAAWLISRAAQHPNEAALALGVVAVQFFGLSKGFFRYGHRLVGHDAALRALADLRVRVYERLEAVGPVGLPDFRSGDLMARFVSDVESLQDLLVRVIFPFGIAALAGAAAVALVWSILSAAGLILLGALLLAATALPWLTGRLARRRQAAEAAARGEIAAAVVDLVRGAPELAAYGASARYLERAAAVDAELARSAWGGARTAGVGQALATLLPALSMVASLALGVAAVHAGHFNVVLLAVIAVVPLAAFEVVSGLPVATQVLQNVRRSLGRVFRVLSANPVVREPRAPKPLPGCASWVRVRGLRCRRPGASEWALDGVDLDLEAGRRVAVVGRSGAGKSTLGAVLLRFLSYQGGSATLGGVELHDLRGEDARRAIGLLAQDAHVFNGTIEANLRLARHDASGPELRRALERARLSEWTEALPAGLDTEVGEFGSRMSGGQRQRLAAARLLLAGFPVVVLDEPGEHLDTETADAIVADLVTADPSQAVLLITHRLAGLEEFDEVIVLEAGRVVERGTPNELLVSDGAYADMWRREANMR